MSDILASAVSKFLSSHCKNNTPLLVGFSGGPDSLALLHVMLELRTKHQLRFALAHVDHGWRVESKGEAEEIKLMAERLGLTLHLKTLAKADIKGNIEAGYREERLKFFASLCEAHGYHAVLLAHHADDLAETVLKRVLEGAGVARLGGMEGETELYGMKVWRPLLKVSKKEILAWLAERRLEGFSDSTNFDPKYMRARLRTQITPFLVESFGKEINTALCKLGDESAEIKKYFDQKTASYLSRIVSGSWGAFLDLRHEHPESPMELKHLIRNFCVRHGMTLSRESLEQAVDLVSSCAVNKRLISGSGDYTKILNIDRGRLFLLSGNLETDKN